MSTVRSRAGSRAARVRSRRPARPAVDPRRPLGTLIEEERTPDGPLAPALTIFLAGAECPFTCVFCDLWRHTLERPTAAGDLPAQVELALEALPPGELALLKRLKLYNASNFFEPRAVPPADLPALAELAAPFSRVVVECHTRLIGYACYDLADSLAGVLEVAMGLETIHPRALPRLGKQMSLADFDRAAGALEKRGIALRVFVLVGAPFVPAAEAAEWAVRSADHAFERGAETVALIPVRGGNGELERLAAAGEFQPPTLDVLEAALDGALELEAVRGGRAVVSADLWDLDRFADCPACFAARKARLERMNRSGRAEPRIECGACATARAGSTLGSPLPPSAGGEA